MQNLSGNITGFYKGSGLSEVKRAFNEIHLSKHTKSESQRVKNEYTGIHQNTLDLRELAA